MLLRCLALIMSLSLSGCFLAPAVDSMRKAGLTEKSREGLLPTELKRFHQDLFWGSYNDALGYAAPEKFEDLREVLIKSKERGRVVESNIDDMNFTEDSYGADVEVSMRIHETATNLLRTYRTREKWVFTITRGWQLDSMEEIGRI